MCTYYKVICIFVINLCTYANYSSICAFRVRCSNTTHDGDKFFSTSKLTMLLLAPQIPVNIVNHNNLAMILICSRVVRVSVNTVLSCLLNITGICSSVCETVQQCIREEAVSLIHFIKAFDSYKTSRTSIFGYRL